MGLQETEAAAAAVAVSPDTRVKLADIEAAIVGEFYLAGFEFGRAASRDGRVNVCRAGLPQATIAAAASALTICLIVLRNGFCVIGKSAPADPANFNPDLGCKFAREDAIRQLWPLMGFALRDRLHAAG